MVNNITNFSVPIFGGENYDFWKIKIKTLLRSHGLWRYVDEGHKSKKMKVVSVIRKRKSSRQKECRMPRCYI